MFENKWKSYYLYFRLGVSRKSLTRGKIYSGVDWWMKTGAPITTKSWWGNWKVKQIGLKEGHNDWLTQNKPNSKWNTNTDLGLVQNQKQRTKPETVAKKLFWLREEDKIRSKPKLWIRFSNSIYYSMSALF